MLTELQINKLKRFFHILDYDRNGVIEREDFTGIAENLCILWRIKEGEEQYTRIMGKFEEGWKNFNLFVNNNEGKANLNHWLSFADQVIVNGDEDIFNEYMEDFVGEIFDNFDTDKDEYLDIDEFIDFFVSYRIEVRFAAKSFRKLDMNKDDLISRSELIKSVKEYFRSDNPEDQGNWLFGKEFLFD